MPPATGPVLLFVLLALLAALVATLGAARRGLAPGRAALFGRLILLGECGVFGVLAGLGLPLSYAGLAGLAFGLPFTLRQRSPEEEETRIHAQYWWR